MKILLIVFLSMFSASLNAQIPKSGTYTYNYCDLEYNACISKCKIRIKGNKIWVYAPANLTLIKEGELFEIGTLYKHSSGKWVIRPLKQKTVEVFEGSNEPMCWIDFKKKQFWTF